MNVVIVCFFIHQSPLFLPYVTQSCFSIPLAAQGGGIWLGFFRKKTQTLVPVVSLFSSEPETRGIECVFSCDNSKIG